MRGQMHLQRKSFMKINTKNAVETMELGMIGLGRMGASRVGRRLRAGHRCVVSDLQPEFVQALVAEGAVGTASLEDFANKLKKARAVSMYDWVSMEFSWKHARDMRAPNQRSVL